MTPLLSEIGLALDLIGAVALGLGLFRGKQPSTFGGDVRSEETVAEDRAYGAVGLLFLGLGFFLQFLSNLGLAEVRHAWCGIVAGVATLVIGSVAAYRLYGFLHRKKIPGQIRDTLHSLKRRIWLDR